MGQINSSWIDSASEKALRLRLIVPRARECEVSALGTERPKFAPKWSAMTTPSAAELLGNLNCLRPRRGLWIMKSFAVGAHAEPLASLCSAPPDAVAEATRAANARIPSIAELHHELVPFDADLAQRMSDRGVRILRATDAGELLPRLAANRDFFECRFCPWAERCWGLPA